MSEEAILPKSLVEQILDETFGPLRENSTFDNRVLHRLERLAKNGELVKHQSVTNALTAEWSKEDENSRT